MYIMYAHISSFRRIIIVYTSDFIIHSVLYFWIGLSSQKLDDVLENCSNIVVCWK